MPRHGATHTTHQELYLAGGDVNVVLEPMLHRQPPRTDEQENNATVLGFLRDNNLTEAVAHQHRSCEIFTHVTDQLATTPGTQTRKAKLSHLFMNDACLAACRATGWTEYNPLYPGADHGIQWCALTVNQHAAGHHAAPACEPRTNWRGPITETQSAGWSGTPVELQFTRPANTHGAPPDLTPGGTSPTPKT